MRTHDLSRRSSRPNWRRLPGLLAVTVLLAVTALLLAGCGVSAQGPVETQGNCALDECAVPAENPTEQSTDCPVAGCTVRADDPIAQHEGWQVSYADTFNGRLDDNRWGAYGWGRQAPGNGAMGLYKVSNVYTSHGALTLRTQYREGAWTSAGVSGAPGYSAAGGRWEVRARFERGTGIGYAFLLYPDDETWPPEINFAEGRVNGPSLMAAYHWGARNNQDQRFLQVPTMDQWHTYGVIIEPDRLIFTFDGKPWVEMENDHVTTKQMWVGFQTGAMDPKGSAKQYETVPGGVPNPLTPDTSVVEIDWVAHYVRN